MKYFPAALLLAVAGALGACNDTPSVNHQPITGNHPAPAPADTTAVLDTTAAVRSAVPFVPPTKAGDQSPSPPESRTH